MVAIVEGVTVSKTFKTNEAKCNEALVNKYTLPKSDNQLQYLTDEKPKDDVMMVEKLDEAIRFSYVATCAITLRELYFENEDDRYAFHLILFYFNLKMI